MEIEAGVKLPSILNAIRHRFVVSAGLRGDDPMISGMMELPLTISSLLTHAEKYHSDTPIIWIETSGEKRRSNWGEIARRSKKLGDSLTQLGLQRGDRCGTIAWNNARHLEVYFGTSGAGFVCHTINPRLSPDELVYVINHAEDKVLFFDETFLPLVSAIAPRLDRVERFVVFSLSDEGAQEALPASILYDKFISSGSPDFEWPALDENLASSLCYTSGTTGNPKGVLYSHRSTVLHSLVASLPDSMNISARSTIMPAVPMFHVNAWGVPYAAPLVGASLVLPGPRLDGPSLLSLIDAEKVTLALGVPTIWQGLLAAAREAGSKLVSLDSTIVGGAACPPSMIAAFRDEFDVDTIHAWGMTEMSPIGTLNQPLAKHSALPAEERSAIRNCQGRPPFGVELRLVDDQGNRIAEDGETQGNLEVKGHWILEEYFQTDHSPNHEGYFPTGDIATIDGNGYMNIRDRAKDVIKSGGEWISSVELENLALSHYDVLDAAVIGVAHPKWDERPILIAVRARQSSLAVEELTAFIAKSVPRWQVPDDVIFVESLPRGATGKVLKRTLREQYATHLISADGVEDADV